MFEQYHCREKLDAGHYKDFKGYMFSIIRLDIWIYLNIPSVAKGQKVEKKSQLGFATLAKFWPWYLYDVLYLSKAQVVYKNLLTMNNVYSEVWIS